MTIAEWVRLVTGGILLLAGLFFFVTSVIGNLRFSNAQARMHSAGLGDTLGILCVFCGVAILCFSAVFVLKLALIAALIWISGPACSHLIAGMLAGEKPGKKEEMRKR